MQQEQEIFKKGSITHYLSSRFFSKKVRRDIMRLYSFARVIDNYVDEQPTQPKKVQQLEQEYKNAMKEPHFDAIAHQWDEVDKRIIKNIVHLSHKYKFEPEWVPAFFASMKMDINNKTYATLNDSLRYVNGAAEVIGLMVARILRLDKERELPDAPKKKDIKNNKFRFVKQASEYTVKKLQPDPRLQNISDKNIQEINKSAMMAGRAMFWIYALRDISEDSERTRCYFPQADLNRFKLKDLKVQTTNENPEAFRQFVELQLERYRQWQAEALKGMKFVPRRSRIALQTAVDMQNWIAKKIAKDPTIVYRTRVEPRKNKIIRRAIKNSARLKKH